MDVYTDDLVAPYLGVLVSFEMMKAWAAALDPGRK